VRAVDLCKCTMHTTHIVQDVQAVQGNCFLGDECRKALVIGLDLASDGHFGNRLAKSVRCQRSRN
jgi:hypothetical protein